tara:strand:- start:1609 stop:3240 length:1632 start_codon:yes stop_codon:yes gene_type:complete
MAESTKEQVKNQKTILDLLTDISKKAVEIRKEFEKQNDAASGVAEVIKAQSDRLDKDKANRDAAFSIVLKARQQQEKEFNEIQEMRRGGNAEDQKVAEELLKVGRDRTQTAIDTFLIMDKEYELAKKRKKELEAMGPIAEQQMDQAKQLGDSITGFINSLPGGELLTKTLGIDKLGDDLKEGVVNNFKNMGKEGVKSAGMLTPAVASIKAAFNSLKVALSTNPLFAFMTVAAAIGAALIAIRNFNKEVRDTASELNVSAAQAREMAIQLKFAEASLKLQGFDSEKLKVNLTEIATEFGTMEVATVENAKNITKMAQEMGVAGTEVVKFNKVMMDLTGASFDVASNIAQSVADLAESEGVAVGNVMKDVASNAETFAKFSMDGAEGLARAAVEAAKIGGELKTVLEAADNLLKFESSLTAQFKAQVLTGKQINTETARRLALEGDIAGLTTEIQDIVRGIGDIQSLNVIERESIAAAIGISVRDLQRIARGEQMEQQQSVQDVLEEQVGTTNSLLSKINDKTEEQYDLLNGGKLKTSINPEFFQ